MNFLSKFEAIEVPSITNGVLLPTITLDEKTLNKFSIPSGASNYEALRRMAYKGFLEKLERGKIRQEDKNKYIERVKVELEIVEKLKFTDYFLIIADMVNFCRESDIPVGFGRGSASGSCLLFLLGVTGVDPIKFNLLFERFISPSRSKFSVLDGKIYLSGSIPDVDQDVCFARRQEVVDYLQAKYPNRISRILNIATLTGKSLIKESGKVVYEKHESEMHEISNMVPAIFGKIENIEKTYDNNPRFKAWCDEFPIAFDMALHLRDLVKNKSVHASGLTLSNPPIDTICPLELNSEGHIVSGFNMDDLSEMIVKIDLLALKTLTHIDLVCKMAKIKMDDIDFEDPEIYKYLSNTRHFYGIFQLEADFAQQVCKRIKPENVEELSHIMSLARPGALAFITEYIELKKSGEVKSLHPEFDPILDKSRGIIIFQEQIMLILNKMGISLEDSYQVIKIIGKKLTDKVDEWEEIVYRNAEKNNFSKEIASLVWKTIKASADYSFNASHAISYSILAAITAYLKHKYPLEFLFGCLEMAKFETKPHEEIQKITAEMVEMGIKILPPDFSIGNEGFTLDGNNVRFGLTAIKGISDLTIEKLRNFSIKDANKFEIFQSASQTGIDVGTLSALIQAGALIDNQGSRNKLVLECRLWNLLTDREKEYCLANGHKFDYDIIEMVKNIGDWVGVNGKSFSRKTRPDTIRKNYEPFKKMYELNSFNEELANFRFEEELLGFSYSTNLQKIFSKTCPELLTIREADNMENKETGTFVGKVDNVVHATSKNKKRYTKIFFSDGTGSIIGLLFDPNRERLEKEKKIPKIGEICGFKGQKSNDILFLSALSPQGGKIFTQVSDVKKELLSEK